MEDDPTALIQPCPHLPGIGSSRFPASALGAFRQGPRRGDFYEMALRCAQSRWLEGLPAQALLMLNRAMGARLDAALDHDLLMRHPLPYRAVGWILRHGGAGGFLGNPRRHFQHLATRMSGHDPERRTARAWACWELARRVNPDWPPDLDQLESESLTEPGLEQIEHDLSTHGLRGEVGEWRLALSEV